MKSNTKVRNGLAIAVAVIALLATFLFVAMPNAVAEEDPAPVGTETGLPAEPDPEPEPEQPETGLPAEPDPEPEPEQPETDLPAEAIEPSSDGMAPVGDATDTVGSPAEQPLRSPNANEGSLPETSPISMHIVSVNGSPIEPAIVYPVPLYGAVVLEATTTAPSGEFYIAFASCLDNEEIAFADGEGNAVQAERLPLKTKTGIIDITIENGPVFKITGLEPGATLNVTITGTAGSYIAASAGRWACISFVAKDKVEAYGQVSTSYSPNEAFEGMDSALCSFDTPCLALELFDQNGTRIVPASNGSGPPSSYFLLGVYDWAQIAAGSLYNGDRAPLDELSKYVSGFVLLDEDGNEVGRVPLERGCSFAFPSLGTYSIDIVRADGVSEDDYPFDPVTVEVSTTGADHISAVLPMFGTPGGTPRLFFTDYAAYNTYVIKVNGSPVPVATTSELMSLAMSLSSGASSSLGNVQSPNTGRAISKLTMNIPDAIAPADPSVVMKIVEDEGKVDATTASYEDEISWESRINVGGYNPFDCFIELRYDVSNQNYPTGSGVNPLFEYGAPTVKFSVVTSDGELLIDLVEGEDYTLDSPEGFFRIDKGYKNGREETLNPRSDLNGTWWQDWYEPLSAQIAQAGADASGYFLHPFFQKQIITITSENGKSIEAKVTAACEEAGIVADDVLFQGYVVGNTGTLASTAYTGGYGNPARVLAFARPLAPRPPDPPIYKLAAKSLEPNPDAEISPDYYTNASGYANIGYDTTVVYTSAVTVHKVDENKNDLLGAEFSIETSAGETPEGRVVDGQAEHLVLSHFIPGFSLIRPVPDSVNDVSRRNLTSIGEPATRDISPTGDPVNSEAYLTYAGLKEGSYVIKEVVAPTGYAPGDDIALELSADLPDTIVSGYEFCRWTAKVNGEDIPIVNQLADEYPDVDDDAYQMFSCNSSFIVLRVMDEPNELTVTKVWEDDDDAEGLRPQSVSVQLYCQEAADGERTEFGDVVTLDEGNDWSYTWTRLDQNKIWSVEEVAVPEGYEAEMTGSFEEGLTVTNTHTPGDNPPVNPPDDNPPVNPPDDNQPVNPPSGKTHVSPRATPSSGSVPKTGDQTPLHVLGALATAGAALVAMVGATRRKADK